MSRRPYLEAAMVARGGCAQDESVAFGTSAPGADAKEAHDVLVDPVQERSGNSDKNDHRETVYHAHTNLQAIRPLATGACLASDLGAFYVNTCSRSEQCRRRRVKMTRSAATLGQAVQEASQSRRFRTSTLPISMTTKPTLDRIAIERTLEANRLC